MAKNKNEIKNHRCKRKTSSPELLCAQHARILPTCACCLEPVFPGSERHLQTPCGHAFHFECAQKWTIQRESSGIKTTCPTCRSAFSHCMRTLLDTTLGIRQIISSMTSIYAGGVTWRFTSSDELVDFSKSLIKKPSCTIVAENTYVVESLKGRKMMFSTPGEPGQVLQMLLIKIHDLCADYFKAKDHRERHEQIARFHLSHGKQLKCSKF